MLGQDFELGQTVRDKRRREFMVLKDLEEIRKLAREAARGPWKVAEGGVGVYARNVDGDLGSKVLVADCLPEKQEEPGCVIQARKNADFIAAANFWVMALCDEVEQLMKEVRKKDRMVEFLAAELADPKVSSQVEFWQFEAAKAVAGEDWSYFENFEDLTPLSIGLICE